MSVQVRRRAYSTVLNDFVRVARAPIADLTAQSRRARLCHERTSSSTSSDRWREPRGRWCFANDAQLK
jgi:hypothetical protein